MMRLGFGRYASRFHPAKLFRPGDNGGFWDFRPPYLFQDSAGTIPAGVGDPVGYVKDLSGNGLPFKQETTSYKPNASVDPSDGLYYAHFDGVDDYMFSYGFFDSANGGGHTPYTCVFAAAIYDNTSPGDNVIRDYVVGSQNAGYSGFDIGHSQRNWILIHHWGASEALALSRNVQFGVREIHTAINKHPGGEYRINGSLIGSSSTAPSTDHSEWGNPLSVAVAGYSLIKTNCDVYSIFFIKRVLSQAEIARLEHWMARRARISL